MLSNEEKREAIEKAFKRYWKEATDPFLPCVACPYFDQDALTEAIVIPVEVEHIKDTSGWQTLVNGDFMSVPGILRPIPMLSWQLPGKHGKPGKATIIIIPEEEK